MMQKKSAGILIADDNPDNLKVLSETLKDIDSDIRIATDGEMTLASIEAEPPELLLLDIHMPRLDGYQVCRQLKAELRFQDIPIIFISALSESFNKVKGFELGAVDYISKPFQIEEVRARVKTHLANSRHSRELEMFNKAMLDREMRIIELKEEVNALYKELGRTEPYLEELDASLGERIDQEKL